MADPPVRIAPPPDQRLGAWERLGLILMLGLVSGAIVAWYAAADTVWFALRFGDSGQRIEAARTLASQGADGLPGLRQLLIDDDPDVRMAAVRAVASLAETAPGAFDALTPMLDDSDSQVRVAAVRALSSFAGSGPVPLDRLIALLQQRNASVRKAAASALPAFGSEAGRAAVPLLAASLDWRRSHPRAGRADNPFEAVIDTLGVSIVPGLAAAADHPTRGIRILAARQLVQIRKSPAARKALQELLTGPFEDVRALAARWSVAPTAPTVQELGTLIRLLTDESTRAPAAEALSAAGNALGALRTIDEDTARDLVPILLESDQIPGRVAADLLAAMGPAAIPALRLGVADGTETARLRAIEALVFQGPGAALALGELEKALKHHGMHQPVIRVLGAMGRPGLPVLRRVARFRDLEVRRAAFDAFGRIGAPEPDVLRTLYAGLGQGKALRAAAMAALLQLGPEGIRRLGRGLRHDSSKVQLAVATALAEYEGDGSPAISTLLAVRRRKSKRLRVLVVLALGRHGTNVPEVRKALLDMKSDRSAKVRAALATTLGGWPRDAELNGALEALAKDRYSTVRDAAKAVLGDE